MKKYFALLLSILLAVGGLFGCGPADKKEPVKPAVNQEETKKEEAKQEAPKEEVVLKEGEVIRADAPTLSDLVYQKSIEKKYAQTFSVDYYEGGYTLLEMNHGGQYLIIPEGKEAPQGLDDEITLIQRPLTGVYVANTPTMSMLNGLNALDKATYTGTEEKSWLVPAIQEKVKDGSLIFAGKYSEPDYEMLTKGGCNLCIQSGMVDSKPEVVEKFKELGVPMIVDRSGEENHPLARVEWFKFYGALFDLDMNQVNEAFQKQVDVVESLTQAESTGKTVAIFFISSKGTLYVRNTDDYVTKMVELAGGKYIFDELADSGSNSTKMEMESFYEKAKDADYILYMYSIGGKPDTIEKLVEKNALLADFKAVKEGNVWGTCPEFFQIADSLGSMVGDIHTMLTAEKDVTKLDYVFKIQ